MSPPAAAPAAMQCIAWAGYVVSAPESYRMAAVTGAYRRGTFALADDDRVRLELAWDTAGGRRINAERITRRCVARAAGGRRRAKRLQIENVQLEGFTNVVRWRGTNPKQRQKESCDHVVGYCSLTKRFLRMAYQPGTEEQDDAFRQRMLPTIRDQHPDRPQKWRFFGIGFDAPAGLLYEDAKLNLGDMSVAMADAKRRRLLTVRYVYPADLALARQDLRQWLMAFLRTRPQRYATVGEDRIEPLTSPYDNGLAVLARRRLAGWLWPWQRFRRQLTWLIHDKAAGRLILLQAAGNRPQLLARLLDEAVGGLHHSSNADQADTPK